MATPTLQQAAEATIALEAGDDVEARRLYGRGAIESSSSSASSETSPPALPPAVVSLSQASFDTGRAPEAPESTIGGQTTCVVCFANPKTHIAVPCGHQCVCAQCSAEIQQKNGVCPYCRETVMMWMLARVV